MHMAGIWPSPDGLLKASLTALCPTPQAPVRYLVNNFLTRLTTWNKLSTISLRPISIQAS